MRQIKIMIVLLIILALLATHCEDEHCHKHFYLMNNSDKVLWVTRSLISPNDTLFYRSDIPSLQSISANPGQVYKLGENKNSGLWVRGCFEEYSHSAEVHVFIFDMDIINTIDRDTIIKNYMLLQRYDLTIEDLQRLNWQITYPPSEAMRDVKMYPPYKIQ
jgi:hypothetical protein